MHLSEVTRVHTNVYLRHHALFSYVSYVLHLHTLSADF